MINFNFIRSYHGVYKMKSIRDKMKDDQTRLLIALVLLAVGIYAFIHTSTFNGKQISDVLLNMIKSFA